MKEKMYALADKYYDDIVGTAQEMLRIKSTSGEEGELARYTADKMKELGYDDVNIDAAGNVLGCVRGTGGGKSLMLNCHLDTVEEGDEALWKYGPRSGALAEGKLWGRGASDTKGPFAIQVWVPAILKKEGLLPKGDLWVTGVVHEETSGLGATAMVKDGFHTDFAISGEATENDICIGCRGAWAIEVRATGKSCHASIPHTGINPFGFIERFLPALHDYELMSDPFYGKSTLTPTRITSSEKGTNLVPNTVTLTIDYRSIPREETDEIVAKIHAIAESCKPEGVSVETWLLVNKSVSYTGYTAMAEQGAPPHFIEPDHVLVTTAKKELEALFGREVKLKPWGFGTDCGRFAKGGIAMIGFSPAEIRYAHTTEDQIDLKMFRDGVAGYLALATALCGMGG